MNLVYISRGGRGKGRSCPGGGDRYLAQVFLVDATGMTGVVSVRVAPMQAPKWQPHATSITSAYPTLNPFSFTTTTNTTQARPSLNETLC